MNCTTRLKIGDINKNFICVLCGGYYVDATTIIECLHSFCRTCIVTYLKTSKSCPVCDTIVHKTRPHQNIRSDKLLQDLVYKLVPGLYKDEMRRRREFYTAHYDAAPKRPGEERGDEMSDRFAYTEEENISLALHFCPDGAVERVDFRRVFATKEDLKARMEKRFKEAVDVRYLQCKAAVTIGHLKKFVRLKYGLAPHFQVDMFYNDEPLRNSCSLCDVAFFFNWTRRAPLMLTFSVFESTGREAVEKKCPFLSKHTPLKFKPAARGVTGTKSTPAVARKTETSMVAPTLAATPTPLPVIAEPSTKAASLDAPTEIPSKLQLLPSTNTKNNQSKPKSPLSVTLPARTEASKQCTSSGKRPAVFTKQTTSSSKRPCDSSKQLQSSSKRSCDSNTLPPGPSKRPCDSSTLPPGPSKRPCDSSTLPPGPSKHPPMTKSSSLGKRPATTPVPIAPAPVPAKVPALGFAHTDIARSIKPDPDSKARDQNCSVTPNLVSLLPVEMAQLSLSKAPCLKEASKPSSTITFSVSSILNAVTSRNGVASVSLSSKPSPVPVTTVDLTTATSGPFIFSSTTSSGSSHQPASAKPKFVAPTKTTALGQNLPSRHLETSFSSSSSPCSSVLSVSSSATVSVTQSSPANSVASPTPATSASPTPAAVPIQQSQTQGSDILHSHPTPVTKKTEKNTNTGTKNINLTSLSKTDQRHLPNFTPETRDAKMDIAPTSNQPKNKSSSSDRVTSAISRSRSQPAWVSSPSKDTVPNTNSISPPSISSTTVFMPHSMPDRMEAGVSPATSPTSNGPTSSGLIVAHPKQTKQKKIADIANTLHKRMSDALLTMVTKRASSPSNRKPSQSASPAQKPYSSVHTQSDMREKTAVSTLSRADLSAKQSLQNVPPSGHLLANSNFSQNSQSDEPLNLVKRDQEIVRFTNGMFILDIPPSAT